MNRNHVQRLCGRIESYETKIWDFETIIYFFIWKKSLYRHPGQTKVTANVKLTKTRWQPYLCAMNISRDHPNQTVFQSTLSLEFPGPSFPIAWIDIKRTFHWVLHQSHKHALPYTFPAKKVEKAQLFWLHVQISWPCCLSFVLKQNFYNFCLKLDEKNARIHNRNCLMDVIYFLRNICWKKPICLIIIHSKYFALSDWLNSPANSLLPPGVYHIWKMYAITHRFKGVTSSSLVFS